MPRAAARHRYDRGPGPEELTRTDGPYYHGALPLPHGPHDRGWIAIDRPG
jgi:hypothetical protein